MQLLGVKPEYRGHGLGRMLVVSAIGIAKHNNYSKTILWTQTSMKLAQKLYETTGFNYVNNRNKHGSDFKVYVLLL